MASDATFGESGDQPPSSICQETVLLVEDEDYVRQVAREILELEGYRVLEACNAHEGARIFEQCQGEVSLLLTDVVMPGMDGRDLAERLAQRQPALKTIFMSGYTENALVRRGVTDLQLAYLQKPFTLQALVMKVREVLNSSATQWIIPHDPMDAEACDGV